MKRDLIIVGMSIVLSIVIGVFLTLVGVGPLMQNVVVSVAIGFTIPTFRRVLMRVAPALPRPVPLISAIAVGALVGVLVLMFWENPGPVGMRRIVVSVLSTTVIFGGVISALFMLQARTTQLEKELRAAERRQLEAERGQLAAQLKMLQAQIEPHFLFNTLANVIALIGADPALARQLLERLIVYLRVRAQTPARWRTRSNCCVLILTFAASAWASACTTRSTYRSSWRGERCRRCCSNRWSRTRLNMGWNPK